MATVIIWTANINPKNVHKFEKERKIETSSLFEILMGLSEILRNALNSNYFSIDDSLLLSKKKYGTRNFLLDKHKAKRHLYAI